MVWTHLATWAHVPEGPGDTPCSARSIPGPREGGGLLLPWCQRGLPSRRRGGCSLPGQPVLEVTLNGGHLSPVSRSLSYSQETPLPESGVWTVGISVNKPGVRTDCGDRLVGREPASPGASVPPRSGGSDHSASPWPLHSLCPSANAQTITMASGDPPARTSLSGDTDTHMHVHKTHTTDQVSPSCTRFTQKCSKNSAPLKNKSDCNA